MPRIIGNLPADRWENVVLQAFKNQLPTDWIVMPSVKWTLEKNGYVRDAEADFVVLAPELGLIVVEVKGSKEFKVGEDGVWLRKENNDTWTKLREAPPEQAMRNMYNLIEALNSKHGWSQFPGLFSYLVVYPQGKADSLPCMFDESTIATFRHMNQLASRLRVSLEKRGNGQRSNQFSTQILESIIDQLKNRKFHVQKVDTGEHVTNDVNKIEQLTRQQFASLKGLFQLPNVAIIGPAGSGKTILALWRLQALIDQGSRAIYVCYNRALAESLRFRNPDHAEFIWNVDRLFLEICPQHQRNNIDLEVFYSDLLPCLVLDQASTFEKYDAIIVDEGQDFSEERIIALQGLLVDEGQWSFFADWKQDLYSAGSGTPIGSDVVFHLHHNCRNTIKINDATNRYLKSSILSMPGMPIGEPPVIASVANQAKYAWELAKQWSSEGCVVILSPFRYENSAMKGEMSGFGLRLSTDIGDFGKKDTVFFSTIKSFKGMEATAIIVVDVCVPEQNKWFSREDLYVACTRATARLALISSKQNKNVLDYFNDLI